MSKLYVLNRMSYSPAAGSIWTVAKSVWGGVKGFVGGLLGSKTATKIVETALPAAKKVAPYVVPGLVAGAAAALTNGGGGGGRGASGGWGGGRRRRGITATELRGYRKVANLIHKEGMVSRRARGRHS